MAPTAQTSFTAPNQNTAVFDPCKPGAIICYHLVSFCVLFRFRDDKDTITKDFAITICYPIAIAGHLILQAAKHKQSSPDNWSALLLCQTALALNFLLAIIPFVKIEGDQPSKNHGPAKKRLVVLGVASLWIFIACCLIRPWYLTAAISILHCWVLYVSIIGAGFGSWLLVYMFTTAICGIQRVRTVLGVLAVLVMVAMCALPFVPFAVCFMAFLGYLNMLRFMVYDGTAGSLMELDQFLTLLPGCIHFGYSFYGFCRGHAVRIIQKTKEDLPLEL
jgi:hypothetical protein